MANAPNSYEESRRWTKAVSLAASLFAHGISSSDVQDIPADTWTKLTRAIDRKPPSQDCIATVDYVLRQFETARDGRLRVVAKKHRSRKAKEAKVGTT
jgi:hypothetical protein